MICRTEMNIYRKLNTDKVVVTEVVINRARGRKNITGYQFMIKTNWTISKLHYDLLCVVRLTYPDK